MRVVAGLALALLLGACAETVFEKPPLAEVACDTRLAGHWNSAGDKGEADGDVQLDISESCRLEVTDHHQGAIRQGDPTQLHVGRLGTQDYAWVDSMWSQQRFDSDLVTQAGDVNVFRYQLSNGDLVLNATDDTAIAHRIIDGDISGDTSKTGKGLHNRITGAPQPKLLESAGFFSKELIVFHKGGGSGKP